MQKRGATAASLFRVPPQSGVLSRAMSPDPSTFHTWTLPNGIRCVHLEDGRNVGHCGLLIEAGSRDELDRENGLAHFIEHSLFKGTAKRRTFHILNRLDSVGAELNAYTSKEETWITASYLSEHLGRAVELIADIAFHSTFPEREIAKERDVIIDEIHAWRDNPGDAIFDEFPIDVHSGGMDLKFPHHDNEIAQSEAYYGCDCWINYFWHTGPLNINGKKMSKSLKNFITIKDILEKFTGKQLRMMFLLNRWDSLMNYNPKTSFDEAVRKESQFNEMFKQVQSLINMKKS